MTEQTTTPIDLDGVEALDAVHRTGSYLAAARELGVSHPTIRRRIDALEAQTGLTLLERSGDGAGLTDAGETVVRHGRLLLRDAARRLSSVRRSAGTPTGLLRVALPQGMPPMMMDAGTAVLGAQFPELRLQVRFHGGPGDAGREDPEIMFQMSYSPPTGAWDTYRLGSVVEQLVASRRYLAAKGPIERL